MNNMNVNENNNDGDEMVDLLLLLLSSSSSPPLLPSVFFSCVFPRLRHRQSLVRSDISMPMNLPLNPIL